MSEENSCLTFLFFVCLSLTLLDGCIHRIMVIHDPCMHPCILFYSDSYYDARMEVKHGQKLAEHTGVHC